MFFSSHEFDTLKLKLFEAVDDDEIDEFKHIFYEMTSKKQQEMMLTTKSHIGRNLLHRSCIQGNFKIVEVILEFMKKLDLNLNEKDKRGYSAANLAVIKGYPELSVWEQNVGFEHISALHLDGGVYTRRYLIIKALSNFKSNIEYSKYGLNTPLHWACYYADVNTINFYICLERERFEKVREKVEKELERRRPKKNSNSQGKVFDASLRFGNHEKMSRKEKKRLSKRKATMKKENDILWEIELKMMSKANSDYLYPIDLIMKFVKDDDEEGDENDMEFDNISKRKESEDFNKNEEKKDYDYIFNHSQRAEKILKKLLVSFESRIIKKTNTKLMTQGIDKLIASQFNKIAQGNGGEALKKRAKTAVEHLISRYTEHSNQSGIEENINPMNTKKKLKRIFPIMFDDRLTNIQRFFHHLLYWAVKMKMQSLIEALIVAEYVSPFTHTLDGKSPFHLACEQGNLELIHFFLSAKYVNFRTEQEIPPSSYLNIVTNTTYESGFHLAILNKKFKVARYMIERGSNPSTYNYRGWQPFESYVKEDVKELEDLWRNKYRKRKLRQISMVDINELEEEMFTQYRSGYQYVLYVGMDKDKIQDCIIYKQLVKIKENCDQKKQGKFEFAVFKSMQQRSKKFYAAIKVGIKLKRHYAEKLKFRIFNKRLGFFKLYEMERRGDDKYKIKKNDEFEMLRDYQTQAILLYILNNEFNLKDFENLKIIKEHYPLHDLYRRQQLVKSYSFYQILVMNLVKGGPNQISKINSAFYYLGPTAGYLLGFSLLLKSYLQFYIAIPIIFFALLLVISGDISFWQNVLVFFSIWSLGFVVRVAWSRRFNELNYSWDFREIMKDRVLSEGRYEVDKVTGEVTNMVDKRRLRQYFKFSSFVVYILTLIPIFVAIFLIPRIIDLPNINEDTKDIYLYIYGIITGLYSSLVEIIQKKFRSKYSNFEVEVVLYIVNYLMVLGIFMYAFDLRYFSAYFNSYTVSCLVFHLIFQEFFPIFNYLVKKNRFEKRWRYLRENAIKNYKCVNKNFSDFTENDSKNFFEFRKSLLVNQQIEYNQGLLKSTNLKDDFFFIFVAFMWLSAFAVNGVGIYIFSYFLFLVIKIWLVIKRSLLFSKRPIACEKFDISKWNTLYNVMSLLVPLHIGLFVTMRTPIISSILDQNVPLDETTTTDLYIYAVYAHISIIISAILPLVIPDKPEWLNKVLYNEKVLKEQYEEKKKKQEIQDSFDKMKFIKAQNLINVDKSQVSQSFYEERRRSRIEKSERETLKLSSDRKEKKKIKSMQELDSPQKSSRTQEESENAEKIGNIDIFEGDDFMLLIGKKDKFKLEQMNLE